LKKTLFSPIKFVSSAMTKAILFPLSIFLLAAALLPQQIFAQASNDCQQLLNEALGYEKAKQYDRALKKYLSAKEECDKVTADSVNHRILDVFEKIEKLRQEAEKAKRQAEANADRALAAETLARRERDKAERSSKANRLAALALAKTETNPTLGLQLASMAWQGSLDSVSHQCTGPGASAVLHDIASDPTTWFYLPLKGHTGAEKSVVFLPDGTRLVTAGADKTVRLWSPEGRLLRILTGHRQGVSKVMYSPDGQYLLSVSSDTTMRLWDRHGGLLQVLSSHRSLVNTVAFSPDSRRLLTASTDSTVRIWDTGNGRILYEWKLGRGSATSAGFSRDGSNILIVEGENLLLWDSIGSIRDSLLTQHAVQQAMFEPSGRYVIARSGQTIYRIALRRNTVDSLQQLSSKMELSPDGNWLLFWSNYSNMVSYCRLEDFGKNIQSNYDVNLVRNYSAVLAPFSDKAVLFGEAVNFLDFTSNRVEFLRGHRRAATSAAFSPNGRFVLTGGVDGNAHLWFKGSTSPLQNGMSMSAYDLQTPYSPDDKKVVVWERAGMNQHSTTLVSLDSFYLSVLDVPATQKVSFSPDGHLLAIIAASDSILRIGGSDGQLRVQIPVPGLRKKSSTRDGEGLLVPATYSTHTTYTSGLLMEFAAGNRRIVLKVPDNQLILFDLQGGQAYPVNHQHLQDVYFKWSADGKLLLTWSYLDTIARIWDEQGAPVATLHGHKLPISNVQFSPDGRHIVTSNDNGSLIWNTSGLLLDKFAGKRLLFSRDGQKYLLTVGGSASLHRLDGTLIRKLNATNYNPDYGGVFQFDEASGFITYHAENGSTMIWDSEGSNLVPVQGVFPGYRFNMLNNLSKYFAPDGSFLTVVHKSGTFSLRLWNARGQLIRIYGGFQDDINYAAISPDGHFVLAASSKKVVVWDINGTLFRTIRPAEGRNLGQVRFLPNSRYVMHVNNFGVPEIWAIGEAFAAQCQTLNKADLLKAGAGVDKAEVLQSANPDELAEISAYYLDRSEWENAQRFCQRLEQVQHRAQTLRDLYEIGEKMALPFDLAPFYQITEFEELLEQADFLYGKEQWRVARDLYEKAEPIKPSARCLNQLHRLADTLRQPFDLARYDRLEGHFEVLYGAAEYLRETRKHQELTKKLYEKALALQNDPYLMQQLYLVCQQDGTPFDTTRFLQTENPGFLHQHGYFFFGRRRWEMARQLFEKSEALQHATENLSSLQMIADSSGQTFDFNRLLTIADANELRFFAQAFFYERKHWDKAEQLYKKSESLQHNYYNLLQLQIIADSTGRVFDFKHFLKINNPIELRRYAAHFLNRKDWKKAEWLYSKTDSLKHQTDNVVKLYDIALNAGRTFDLNRFLISKDAGELNSYANRIAYHARRLAKIKDQVPAAQEAALLGEKILTLDTTATMRTNVANYYNSLGFAQLFIPDGKVAEASIRRGMAIDAAHPPLYTNLPPALLLQGRYREAEALYLEYWYKPYTLTGKKIYLDAFLGDLNDLEKQGVTHPDFEKIRNVLEKAVKNKGIKQ